MVESTKITAEQATAKGWIDALDVIKTPRKYEKRAYQTARQHVNRYIFAKKFVSNKKVIDAACGTGYGCVILKQNNFSHYIGIDISSENIQNAQKQFASSKKVVFIQDDLTAIKNFSTANKCDVFISFETIEHLSNYDLFLKFVYLVLKKEGDFIVSTPNREVTNPDGTLQSLPKTKHHIREWNLPELKALLKKHHFRIQKIYGQSFYFNKKIARFLPGSRTILKKLPQSVIPLALPTILFEPNYYIVHCKKA